MLQWCSTSETNEELWALSWYSLVLPLALHHLVPWCPVARNGLILQVLCGKELRGLRPLWDRAGYYEVVVVLALRASLAEGWTTTTT